jgi:hypothetical protein
MVRSLRLDYFLLKTNWISVLLREVSDEDVLREAKHLQRISDIKKIRRDDLRLGQLIRAIDISAKNALEMAHRLVTGAYVPVNSAATVQQLRELRKSIRMLPKMTLEEEFKVLTANVGSERNQQIIARRFGWDGSEGVTLQEVGDSLKLTRERVRQVCNRLTKQLEGKSFFAPALDRALKFVSHHIPESADAIELKLTDEGLATSHFRLEGILNAAELLDRNIPFAITKVGGKRFVLAPNMEKIMNVITKYLMRIREP